MNKQKHIRSSWCRPAYNSGRYLSGFRKHVAIKDWEMADFLEIPRGQMWRYEKGFTFLSVEQMNKLNSLKQFNLDNFLEFYNGDVENGSWSKR